jgi:Fe-S cluster biogenesis protein NfuA
MNAEHPGALCADISGTLLHINRRLRTHGGAVSAAVVRDGTVAVEFHGACIGCPAIAMTYALAVRPALMASPGVRGVAARQVHVSDAAMRRLDRLAQSVEQREVPHAAP